MHYASSPPEALSLPQGIAEPWSLTPLHPYSSLGKPLNSKAFTSFPMSQGPQIFRGKKTVKDFSAGNFYVWPLQSSAKIREQKEPGYFLGIKEGEI